MNSAALQDAIYNQLSGDSAITNAVVGIYDNPQQVTDPDNNALFPIITIGDDQLNAFDTDTELGTDAIVTVHTWTRASNFYSCKLIQDMIYQTLHRATIAVNDSILIDCMAELQTVARDPDGVTIHGVQQFKVLYQED